MAKHVHKYRSIQLGAGTKVWGCGQPDCNHYLPPHMAKFIEGKASECWDCSHSTIMSVDRMKFALSENDGKVLCQDCMDKRRGIHVELESIDDIDAIIAGMKSTSTDKR